jgi:hypothetical protein
MDVAVTLSEIAHDPDTPTVPPLKLTICPLTVNVPLQVLVGLLGLETTRPAGSVSLNDTPVSPIVFGLLIVNARPVLPPYVILFDPNDFTIVGGLATVRLAEAALPVPPFVEVTLPVVLVTVPDVASVTFTEIVHKLFGATDPPVKLIAIAPELAESVPLHVSVAFGVLATVIPEGNVSLTANPVRAIVLPEGFVMVSVKLVVPFNGMVAAPNALLIEGGVMTVTLADAVPPVPPSVEATVLVVLFFWPAVVPVTFTVNVHAPFAGSVAPDRLIKLDPAAAVIVPAPQVPVSPLGVDITSPAGRVSVNAIPLRLCPVFGFVIVKLRLVLPFNGMLAAPNALLIVGGEATVTLADAVFPAPPLVELTAPVVLFFTPAVVPVTFTEKLQKLLVGSVAPDRLTELAP